MEVGSKRPLGVTPLQVNLISGEHKITLRKEGYDPLRVSLFISPGKPVIARYVLNSQLILTGPPPPSQSEAPLFLGAQVPSRLTHARLKLGPALLSAMSVGSLLTAASMYLLARSSVITRDSAPTRARWFRAQGEAEAYYQLSVTSVSFAALSGVGALAWWLAP